ncbi:MAG: YggS family pyridoxal phosphate-dependent enzyme [Candidatus Puniceispirillaceae bacterium]
MFTDIKSKLAQAAKLADRNANEVSLIAVSKQQPDVRIDSALEGGLRIFGENRVQEAQRRWQPRRALFPDLELHLIGPLQSNKAGDAVALFDIIHTVDRPKIARALKIEMDKQNRQLPCFIQVNTGDEPQKAGIPPKEIPDFLTFCRSEIGLNIAGLMCIPPIDEEAAMHFALLKSYAEHLSLPQLSMGMSGDFEEAIAFGATHIRVGSALFGART